MKQFKNAVAVAIAAAGLYSVSAMAGQAVRWDSADAGQAKDVKWNIVQPSVLDFTITTTDITGSNVTGEVENIGSIKNAGTGNAQFRAEKSTPQRGMWRADGDAEGEYLRFDVRGISTIPVGKCDPTTVPRGYCDFKPGSTGTVYGNVSKPNGDIVKTVSDIKSSRFVANITVTSYNQ